MTRQEHLLVCLAEECLEVAHRVHKALRFGLQEVQPGQPLTNAERVHEEIKDILGVWRMLRQEGVLPVGGVEAGVQAKIAKVERYLAFAEGKAPHPEA